MIKRETLYPLIRKHRILFSILGMLFLIILFLALTSSYEKTFSKSIVIKKPRLQVFHAFFSQEHLLSWFQNAKSVTIDDKLYIGSKVIFHFEREDISFEIIDLVEPELVKWKNFNSTQKFEFRENAIGTVVHFKVFMRGSIAYLFQLINKNKIDERLSESLMTLKNAVEKY